MHWCQSHNNCIDGRNNSSELLFLQCTYTTSYAKLIRYAASALQVYKQVAQSRNRLSTKLSAANKV